MQLGTPTPRPWNRKRLRWRGRPAIEPGVEGNDDDLVFDTMAGLMGWAGILGFLTLALLFARPFLEAYVMPEHLQSGARAFTGYPIVELGDHVGKRAPIREVTVLRYDGDKYVEIEVEENGRAVREHVKAGYLHPTFDACYEFEGYAP